MTQKVQRPFLPAVLTEIRERFDWQLAIDFANAYGGQRLYIPEQPTVIHGIAQKFGVELLAFLVERYGGRTEITVPMGPTGSFQAQRALIRTLLMEGLSNGKVAKLARCHIRTVENARAKMRNEADTAQLKLI